jgi:hypothetical protein
MKHLPTKFFKQGGRRSGSEQDLSAAEVEQIHDKVDRDLKTNGLPSEAELQAEIQVMNEGAD